MRLAIATTCVAILILASCGESSEIPSAGGGGGSDQSRTAAGGSGSDQSRTTDIDVCALLSDAEISGVLGAAPPSKATEPSGPFTGCSWGTGRLIVSIATADSAEG